MNTEATARSMVEQLLPQLEDFEFQTGDGRDAWRADLLAAHLGDDPTSCEHWFGGLVGFAWPGFPGHVACAGCAEWADEDESAGCVFCGGPPAMATVTTERRIIILAWLCADHDPEKD